MLTQLFVIYFGLAAIGIRLSPIPAAIAGCGLNGGAYLTEVFRGGLEAVGRGQVEAAQALGLGRLRFAIGLLRDTSLASAVAAPELSFNARMLVDRTFLSTQIYALVAFLYLAMSLPLALLGRRLERRLAAARER